MEPTNNEQTDIREKVYKVARVGWTQENSLLPIVCMSKKERDALGIEIAKYVKVKKVVEIANQPVAVESLAIVQVQFKDLLGEEVVALSTKLAEALEVTTDSLVTISKDVTESESEAFMLKAREVSRRTFMDMMGY